MYNFKRIAALGLAMTMALGSSLTAFASDSSDVTKPVTTPKEVVGTGEEVYVDKNIMKVTMPTDAAIANFFDYKLDPQGLIAEAKSYGSTPITGTATGIVFLNQASGKAVISNTSDPFKITNKSSIPVDLGVKVSLTAANDGLAVNLASTTSDFKKDDEAGIDDSSKAFYLGLKATNDIERALSGTEKDYNAVLLSGASQYETKFEGGAYKYAEKTNAKFSDFTFTLTGTINKNLGSDTWVTVSGDFDQGRTVTAKNPPVVKLKVTLAPVADPLPVTLKWASVTTSGTKTDVLQIGKTSAPSNKGGFVAADVAKLYVNGREIASGDYTVDADTGYITVELEKIYANYYSDWATATAAQKSAVKSLIKNVKTTASSKPTFYGEL